MRLVYTVCWAVMSVCAALQAQPPATSFDVASVRVAPPDGGPGQRKVPIGARVEGVRVSISRLTLAGLISLSYTVANYQVAGPDWINSPDGKRFDIEARMPEGATREQMPAMLKSLLAERFGLIVHKETRNVPAWILSVGKNGPKLDAAPDHPARPVAVEMINPDLMHQVWYWISLQQLCANLARMFQRPVVDQTGITGEYQIAIDFAAHEMASAQGIRPASGMQVDGLASEPSGAPMLFQSIERLGLRLESKKAPFEMIVVDHVEKMPTEN